MTQFKMHPWQKEVYEKMIKMKSGSVIICGTPPRQQHRMRGLSPSFIILDDLYENKSKNTLTLKQYIRRYLK